MQGSFLKVYVSMNYILRINQSCRHYGMFKLFCNKPIATLVLKQSDIALIEVMSFRVSSNTVIRYLMHVQTMPSNALTWQNTELNGKGNFLMRPLTTGSGRLHIKWFTGSGNRFVKTAIKKSSSCLKLEGQNLYIW